jgi:hypothetical protein
MRWGKGWPCHIEKQREEPIPSPWGRKWSSPPCHPATSCDSHQWVRTKEKETVGAPFRPLSSFCWGRGNPFLLPSKPMGRMPPPRLVSKRVGRGLALPKLSRLLSLLRRFAFLSSLRLSLPVLFVGRGMSRGKGMRVVMDRAALPNESLCHVKNGQEGVHPPRCFNLPSKTRGDVPTGCCSGMAVVSGCNKMRAYLVLN